MRLATDFYKPRTVTWMTAEGDSGYQYYNGAGWYMRTELTAMRAMGIKRVDRVTGAIICHAPADRRRLRGLYDEGLVCNRIFPQPGRHPDRFWRTVAIPLATTDPNLRRIAISGCRL